MATIKTIKMFDENGILTPASKNSFRIWAFVYLVGVKF